MKTAAGKYEWTIKNWRDLLSLSSSEEDNSFYSDIFKVGETSWQIKAWPSNGEQDLEQDLQDQDLVKIKVLMQIETTQKSSAGWSLQYLDDPPTDEKEDSWLKQKAHPKPSLIPQESNDRNKTFK